MIELAKIRTDGGTQSRAAINDETVSDYAEAMADPNTVFPPVVVYYDGKDYWLADGFHRVEAWRRIGRTEVSAEVRQGDRRAAVLHACGANAAHGLRRTNSDKRRAVMTLLDDEEWSGWTARQIARQCGVSHDFVARMKRERASEVSSDDTSVEYPEPTPSDPVRKSSDTSGADKAGTSVAPEAADGPAPDDEPHDSVHAERLNADTAEPEDPATAKMRAEARKMTREALEEEWVGLRLDLEDEKAKRKKAEANAKALKAQLADITADDTTEVIRRQADKIRNSERARFQAEEKAAAALRQVHALKKEIKRITGQEFVL